MKGVVDQAKFWDFAVAEKVFQSQVERTFKEVGWSLFSPAKCEKIQELISMPGGFLGGQPPARMTCEEAIVNNLPRNAAEYRTWWESQTAAPYGFCWCGCGRATNLATSNAVTKHRFKGEPRLYKRGHQLRKPIQSVADRFWQKVVIREDGCWEWVGFLDKAGYGRIRSEGGRAGESVYAHRVSYELHVGEIPKGKELDHLCRRRWCANFNHLEPVAHAENIRRGGAAHVIRSGRCIRGHEAVENGYWLNGKYMWCLKCRDLGWHNGKN